MLAIALATSFVGSSARAEEPAAPDALRAELSCERAVEPGRVRCAIEARTPVGTSIVWSDAVLVEVPSFLSALKGRLGPSDATVREATLSRWAFGLVAKRTGQGEAHAKVRAVVCQSAPPQPRCAPVVVDIRSVVYVGM